MTSLAMLAGMLPMALGFGEGGEQTAPLGWKKDIGDAVKAGEALAELDVPELVEEAEQKQAAVRRTEAEIEQAKRAVETAQANEE